MLTDAERQALDTQCDADLRRQYLLPLLNGKLAAACTAGDLPFLEYYLEKQQSFDAIATPGAPEHWFARLLESALNGPHLEVASLLIQKTRAITSPIHYLSGLAVASRHQAADQLVPIVFEALEHAYVTRLRTPKKHISFCQNILRQQLDTSRSSDSLTQQATYFLQRLQSAVNQHGGTVTPQFQQTMKDIWTATDRLGSWFRQQSELPFWVELVSSITDLRFSALEHTTYWTLQEFAAQCYGINNTTGFSSGQLIFEACQKNAELGIPAVIQLLRRFNIPQKQHPAYLLNPCVCQACKAGFVQTEAEFKKLLQASVGAASSRLQKL